MPARSYFFANMRFLQRKGGDALLRAYARYRELAEPGERVWKLVISGSGEEETRWKRLASSLSLEEQVVWPGFLQYDELPAAYQYAGAFVHPARQEPWGLVVNEAAAAGLPLLVGRNVGAACELLRDGVNGLLVDPDDWEAVAHGLLRLTRLTDSERKAMGAASRRIASEFGPTRFGRAVRRCLELPRGH
jgi:glycosyltransferase involved in cell wall biosynthesis